VPLNESGKGLAFYCVHSVGGEVMSFRHLARLLGADQRFYGIQAPPEMRNSEFPSSVEAMARYYVEALTAFQPEGPYLLGGWSAGSIIALEMAQQLRASGREVALLVALDGAPFNTSAGTSPLSPLYYWKLLRNLPLWIADDLMVDFAFGPFAKRVQNKLFSLTRKAGSTLRGEGDKHGHEVDGFMDTSYYSDGQLAFMRALYRAIKKYVPKEQYSGRVLVYAAQTQPLYHLLDVEAIWAKMVSRLEVVPVRGTHESIIKERHVGALADHLREHLTEFEEDWAAGYHVPIECRTIDDMAETE
jgi:thioesterase domain-containing protein